MGKRLIIPGADFSANAIGDGGIVYTLYQGYASVSGTENIEINTELQTRVRTSELGGSYTIKTNSGFAIRSILKYTPHLDITGAGIYPVTTKENVANVQGATEYTLVNPGGYSIITFCKTDATQNLSPTDDIVAELY